MKKDNKKMWTCPLCIEAKFRHGKMDCDGIASCGNTPNSNAFQYLDKQGKVKTMQGNDAIGIGAISNE